MDGIDTARSLSLNRLVRLRVERAVEMQTAVSCPYQGIGGWQGIQAHAVRYIHNDNWLPTIVAGSTATASVLHARRVIAKRQALVRHAMRVHCESWQIPSYYL